MVDIEKLTGEIQTIPGNTEQYLSDELRSSISTLYEQLTNRAQESNVDKLKDAALLADKIPTVAFIAELEGVEESLITAKLDRRFIGNLLQVYARIAEELDNKIIQTIDALGNQAPLVFDRLTDGGYGSFARFGWYFYSGASALKTSRHIRYINFWIGLIRYLHLAAALTTAGFLLFHQKNELAQLSIFGNIFFACVCAWSSMVAYIPEFVYVTFSSNFFSRWIRKLFTGAATSAPESEIQAQFDSFIEIRKNILSVRMQLRANLRKMLHLAKSGEFKTHYWSSITFDELTDALTRGGQLTYKDRNVLLLLLGISQTFPLISDPDFMIAIAPLVWRRYGYGLIAALVATVLANIIVFDYLKSIPLAKILK